MTEMFRYPNITGQDPFTRIEQLRSWLHQLVDQLNAISAGVQGQSQSAVQVASGGAATPKSAAQATFDEIKSFIIKSSEIADAYYESYTKKLSGIYVAQSEFGTYSEQTSLTMEATSKRLSLAVSNIERIESEANAFADTMIEQLAQIRAQADSINISVQRIESEGVNKVVTDTGYSFAADGLKIRKSNSDLTNLVDDKGMRVIRGEETDSETVMLQANANGVVATDVSVRNYLIIGNHARLEDYNNGTDSKRTACFHIGGS